MKILKLNALCGIKNQLYCQEQYITHKKRVEIDNDYFDINSLFWSEIFDSKHVFEMLKRAQKELSNDETPKIRAILQEPALFLETYADALKNMDVVVNPQKLFQSLETLEIVCFLHTKLYSAPHVLTISQGFIHSKHSALDMEKTCLLPFCNPYWDFIDSKVMPKILEYQPEILILTGVPNLPAFTIAKLVKLKMPNTFIISKEHESEYYSLSKIKRLLCKNSAFFSVYDCVILNNYVDTLTQILQWYYDKKSNSLNNIAGIIFSLNNGKDIVETKCASAIPLQDDLETNYPDHYVCNIKAFPENHCYWNRCSFCGINKKYGYLKNRKWDVRKAGEKIKSLYEKNVKKIWLLDEAIPPIVLNNLANYLVQQNIHVIWHTRTRIEPQFVDRELIELFSLSGLKHILFGFESASNRILKLMEKNNFDFNYLEVAEKIVQEFTFSGIQVHFSAILGFPTETEEERNETVGFLQYLHNTYELFSYNYNTFYLDIGSKIYNKWENYDILSLSFPCAPKYFLENHLDWINAISPQKTNAIHMEQEKYMFQQYQWYPKGALIRPSTFFSFWEYSRYTLYENISDNKNNIFYVDSGQPVIFSSQVVQCELSSESWMLYHLQNHHYVIGGEILQELINASKNNDNFYSFINKYHDSYKESAEHLILQLARKEFFI